MSCNVISAIARRSRCCSSTSIDFKAVNDTFGHEAGDLVLQYVAGFLRRHVREADYLFRWGGDEFLVLMSCNLEQAMQKGIDLKAAFHTTPEAAQLPAGMA